jgi:hypothetical protein
VYKMINRVQLLGLMIRNISMAHLHNIRLKAQSKGGEKQMKCWLELQALIYQYGKNALVKEVIEKVRGK